MWPRFLVKVGSVSFVAGAGLELVLQLTGYNRLLEDGAERRRLEAEIEEQKTLDRMKTKYGEEKIREITKI